MRKSVEVAVAAAVLLVGIGLSWKMVGLGDGADPETGVPASSSGAGAVREAVELEEPESDGGRLSAIQETLRAADTAGAPGPGAAAEESVTTYAWRLVDPFGEPLPGLMVRSRWIAAGDETVANGQTFTGLEGGLVEQTVSWAATPPTSVVMECGMPGYRDLELTLPEAVRGGRIELGDLAVPTVAELYEEPLVAGRVLGSDGSAIERVLAFGFLMDGMRPIPDPELIAVLVNPRSGEFEAWGPARERHTLNLVFSAPGWVAAHAERVEPGTRGLELRLEPAQVVRLHFELPEVEDTPSCILEFWPDPGPVPDTRVPGTHELMRPFNARELRIVEPRTGFVLHREVLPVASKEQLVLDHIDLTETVSWIDVDLLDGRGEPLSLSRVLLERPDGERRWVRTQDGALACFAPRNGGVALVGRARIDGSVGALASLDLADPPESLRLP